MPETTLTVTLPWPPSVNHYWRARGKRRFLAPHAAAWRQEAVVILKSAGVRFTGPVEVTLWFAPPDKRRRDLDNHAKGVLDALVLAGVIVDDGPHVVKRLLLLPMLPERPGFVRVFIRGEA